MLRSKNSETAADNLRNMIPAERIGQPSDIAGVIAFLVSADADYITDVVLPVDGGLAIT